MHLSGRSAIFSVQNDILLAEVIQTPKTYTLSSYFRKANMSIVTLIFFYTDPAFSADKVL